MNLLSSIKSIFSSEEPTEPLYEAQAGELLETHNRYPFTISVYSSGYNTRYSIATLDERYIKCNNNIITGFYFCSYGLSNTFEVCIKAKPLIYDTLDDNNYFSHVNDERVKLLSCNHGSKVDSESLTVISSGYKFDDRFSGQWLRIMLEDEKCIISIGSITTTLLLCNAFNVYKESLILSSVELSDDSLIKF